LDVTLAQYCRVHSLKESNVVTDAAGYPDDLYGPLSAFPDALAHEGKPKSSKSAGHLFYDASISVWNTQYSTTVAAFRVEDARHVPLAPISRMCARPSHELLDPVYLIPGMCTNRVHCSPIFRGFSEDKLGCRDSELPEECASPIQRLSVSQSKAELVLAMSTSVLARVFIVPDEPIATNQPAQVSLHVVARLGWRRAEAPDPE
jgi:hypothetical protein